MSDAELSDFERYFRDPKVGDRVLEPGISGQACKNLRHALRILGFHGEFGESDFSDNYDTALARDVLRFQEARNHSSRDGRCGPGTRRLVTRALFEKFGDSIFRRMTDPEQRSRGHIFVSYARENRQPVEECVRLITRWGFDAWYDDRIGGGEQWNSSIQNKILSCYLLLAFLSQAAVKSQWVGLEVMYAFQNKKDIVPVKLEALSSGHALEMVLLSHQSLDAPQGDLQQLAAANFGGRLKTAIQLAHQRQT